MSSDHVTRGECLRKLKVFVDQINALEKSDSEQSEQTIISIIDDMFEQIETMEELQCAIVIMSPHLCDDNNSKYDYINRFKVCLTELNDPLPRQCDMGMADELIFTIRLIQTAERLCKPKIDVPYNINPYGGVDMKAITKEYKSAKPNLQLEFYSIQREIDVEYNELLGKIQEETEKQMNGIRCQFKSTVDCENICNDSTPLNDGKFYCNIHRGNMASKLLS